MKKNQQTNSEIIEKLEKSTGYSEKVIGNIIEGFYEILKTNLLEGKQLKLEIGVFGIKDVAPRKGINPKTGKEMMISGRRKPYFKFNKKFVELMQTEEINQPPTTEIHQVSEISEATENRQVTEVTKVTENRQVMEEKLIPPPLPDKLKKWFINWNNQTSEVMENELKTMGITGETLVWNQDLDGWKVAKDVPELNYLFG